MKIKTLLFIVVILVIFFFFYLLTNEIRQEQNNFVPPPGFSVVDKLPTMISSTSSISISEVIYINNTLGLTMTLPSGINVNNEVAELHKYELGSGEDKLGQEYKYYEINFSNNSKEESGAYIGVTVKETPYKTITEWLEKDKTRG